MKERIRNERFEWPGYHVGTGGGSPRLASKPDGGETADENGLSGGSEPLST